MSRAYDAKQVALQVYPTRADDGSGLFLDYLGCSEEDFEYEFGESVLDYLYGEERQ